MLQDMHVCGKTGTAQASRFTVHVRDASGQIVLDANNNKPMRRFIETFDGSAHRNLEAPGIDRPTPKESNSDHAWYIGFAPADHPKIAFAVMVEYGGSGGIAAASVARDAARKPASGRAGILTANARHRREEMTTAVELKS